MKTHLIGVGGAGMSALATALAKCGVETTGADRTLGTPNLARLERLGVKIFPDDGSGVDATVSKVVVSTAIEKTNPGLAKAAALGIPVVHRAKALADLLAGRKLVAVAGTCGKSTVTAMLGHVLAECGLDPFCVNGANVAGWDGAVRFGRGGFAVAEVDESDRSLSVFSPYAAIVANSSADHFSKEEMDALFDAFAAKCEGPVIDGRKRDYGEVPSPMPGLHNRRNAAQAVAMAVALGCDEEEARAAIMRFRGVERRLERIPGPSPRPVYDDYAHNPEKLRALCTTLAESCRDGVCVVWRPHGYSPLKKMMDALADVFAATLRPCDALVLLPVYDAGGTADRSVSSDLLADEIERRGAPRPALVSGLDDAFGWCEANRRRFGLFATCGARDPGLPALARRLAAMEA